MELLDIAWKSNKSDDKSKLTMFMFAVIAIFFTISMCKDSIDEWALKNPKKTDKLINNL